MITERTLRKWRGESLHRIQCIENYRPMSDLVKEENERILRLTQELLDQHLLRKEMK